jgi:hypothetical protein
MYLTIDAFEIEFFANGEEYKASVHRIPADYTLPVEYHVFNIKPSIPKAPRAFLFIYNSDEATFETTMASEHPEVVENIFASISKYCSDNRLQLAR